MQLKCGHFEPDGEDVYLPIGFDPDLFLLVEMGITNPLLYLWFGQQYDDEASGSKDGIALAGGSSNWTKMSDSQGIEPYDSGSQGPTIVDWSDSLIATARTATAHGTYARPTTAGLDKDGRSADRSAVFECVTAGTTGGTQPTWPVELGDNSASDNGVIWQKVNAATLRVGYQGVLFCGELTTNGQECYYAAFKADSVEDHGDVDGWTGGIRGA